MTHGLDVLSPKGQKAIEDLRKGLALVGHRYIETNQDRDADIDGFFLTDDGRTILAAYEGKARDMTLDQLRRSFDNEWILTFDKISKGAAIARALRVPLHGVIYLVPDNVALVIKLTDSLGNIITPLRTAVTETKANCNGGKAIRTNAYVRMDKARVCRATEQEAA